MIDLGRRGMFSAMPNIKSAKKRMVLGEQAREKNLDPAWFKGTIDITKQPGQLFIDNVHLSEAGARLTAQAIYRAIWGEEPPR